MLDAPYSAKLRRLVFRCLSRQPGLRPRPRALVAEIQDIVDGITAAAMAAFAEAQPAPACDSICH